MVYRVGKQSKEEGGGFELMPSGSHHPHFTCFAVITYALVGRPFVVALVTGILLNMSMINSFSVCTFVTGLCAFRVKTGLEYSSQRLQMQNTNWADTVIISYHIMESVRLSI